MSYIVNFETISTTGLESSPVAAALAGLRANEARYFSNKYNHQFTTEPAVDRPDIIEYVQNILDTERGITFAAKPLEVSDCVIDGVRWTHVFYEDGLGLNVLYDLNDGGKRAVGFKLSDGMPVPAELADSFKFARQKSKLAGTIRGSYFVIKGTYN